MTAAAASSKWDAPGWTHTKNVDWLWDIPECGPYHQVLFNAIARHVRIEGEVALLTLEELAASGKMGRTKASECLTDLVEWGAVVQEQGGGRSNASRLSVRFTPLRAVVDEAESISELRDTGEVLAASQARVNAERARELVLEAASGDFEQQLLRHQETVRHTDGLGETVRHTA